MGGGGTDEVCCVLVNGTDYCIKDCGGKLHKELVAMYFLFVGLTLAAGTLWFQIKYVKFLPFTALVFVEGILLGTLNQVTGEGLGDLSTSISQWTSIDPFLLMAVFLPALIFSDAMKVNWHVFTSTALYPSLLLAIPGVLIMCFAVGAIAFYVLGYDWSFSACCLLGATLAAPDPVSVVSLLESSLVPTRLNVIMGSESHIADLTALVLFKLFLEFTTEGTDKLEQAGEMVKFFAKMLLLGPLIGLVFGYAGYFVIKQSVSPTRNSDTMVQITTTVIIAYLSFLVAEYNFHCNGVLASVFCAWVIARSAWPKFAKRVVMENVWEAIEFFGNSIIFFLAGVILGDTLYDSISNTITGKDLLNVVIIWASIYAVRLVVVFASFPVLYITSGRRFKFNEATALVVGGIRGAVTVTLGIVALNTRDTEEYVPFLKSSFNTENPQDELERFFFIVGAVTLLTLTVNYTFFPWLLKCLKISSFSKSKEQLNKHFRKRIRQNAAVVYEQVTANDPGYAEISLESIKDVISGLSEVLEDGNDENQDESKQVLDPSMVELADCNMNLLKQVRTTFLNAVKGQYWEQINTGKLPRKSQAALKVLNAVDAALDETVHSLDDYTPLKLEQAMEKVPFTARALGCVDKVLPQCVTIDDWYAYRIKNAALEESVVIATSFLEAHIVAEKKIAEYIGEDETIDTPEEAYVIKESRLLRDQCHTFLDKIVKGDKDILESVSKIKLANAIVESRRLYLELIAEEGLIEERFLEEQMENIRSDQLALERQRKATFKNLASKRLSIQRGAPMAPVGQDQAQVTPNEGEEP